jgi:hypothetical protein
MRIFLFLLVLFLPFDVAFASENSVCEQLEAAYKSLKDRVPISQLERRDQSALNMFEKVTRGSCSDENCRICQVHAYEQVGRLHEKYNRDEQAFKNYLKVAEGYLKEASISVSRQHKLDS